MIYGLVITLFVLACVAWVISLFYIKRSLVPMLAFAIVINILNAIIQLMD